MFDPVATAPGSDTELLNLCIAGGANAKLLALVQVNIFAALSQNASGAHARADGRANCRTGATTCDGADDCADAGGGANFLNVALSRTSVLHADFRIDLADTLAAFVRQRFDGLGTQL